MLLDASSVLGWENWREIDERYGVGRLRGALAGLMDAGLLITRAEAGASVNRLMRGLRSSGA